MTMLNNYVCIKPLNTGPISLSEGEGNEYEVLDSVDHNDGGDTYKNVARGEVIVVAESSVIKTTVKNKERFYVKEEDIIEVFDGPDKNN